MLAINDSNCQSDMTARWWNWNAKKTFDTIWDKVSDPVFDRWCMESELR